MFEHDTAAAIRAVRDRIAACDGFRWQVDELFEPGHTADPQSMADQITRILTLPIGRKPFRSVVDAAGAGVDHVMAFSDLTREAFVRRLGYAETLELK